MTLTGRQRRHLRSLGHALRPVAHVGKDGVTEGVERAIDVALTQHELIKVRLGGEAGEDRHAVATEIGTRTAATVAQVIGRTVLLYRRRTKDPKIVLPTL